MSIPLLDSDVVHIPELLLPNRTSFSKNWKDETGGLASAEQLRDTESFWQASSPMLVATKRTFSGLTEKIINTFSSVTTFTVNTP